MDDKILSSENISDLEDLRIRTHYSRINIGNVAFLKEIIPTDLELIDTKLREVEDLTEKLIAKHG